MAFTDDPMVPSRPPFYEIAEQNMTVPKTGEGVSPVTSSDSIAKKWKPHLRVYIVITALCVVTLMVALDATSLSVALPIIARKLGGTAIEAFWAGTSFLLSSTVFQPNFGSFSHIFGRKPMMLVALAFFTIGATIAALAKNFTIILIGRCFQGVGGGGILTVAQIIVTDLVPLRERAKYFGFQAMMWAVGSVSGPMVGGVFAQDVDWTWIFWLNLPFAAIGFVMIPLFLKLNSKNSATLDKFKRADWVGSLIFIGSTTSILIPITWGGVMYAWDSWRTLVPLIVGLVGLIAFVFYEIYVAVEPVIRLRLFLNRTSAVSYLGVVIHGIVLWDMLYYLPLYYEAVKDMSPVLAGVSLLPQTLTVAPASVVAGIIISKTGRFRWALWLGWAFTIIGMGLMYLLDVETTTVQWIFLNLVGGIGTGTLFQPLICVIQASASSEDLAYAVAMFGFLRTYGESLGVAIGGTIFQNALAKELAKYPMLEKMSSGYAKDAVALVQVIKEMPIGMPGRTELLKSYAASLKIVWISMMGFAIVGGVASLWTEPLSLDRELNTEQGLRTEKRDSGADDEVNI